MSLYPKGIRWWRWWDKKLRVERRCKTRWSIRTQNFKNHKGWHIVKNGHGKEGAIRENGLNCLRDKTVSDTLIIVHQANRTRRKCCLEWNDPLSSVSLLLLPLLLCPGLTHESVSGFLWCNFEFFIQRESAFNGISFFEFQTFLEFIPFLVIVRVASWWWCWSCLSFRRGSDFFPLYSAPPETFIAFSFFACSSFPSWLSFQIQDKCFPSLSWTCRKIQ